MNFFLLSPSNVPCNPHLFPMFIDTWKEKGVSIVERIEDADVVLMDLHVRSHDYNQRDIDYTLHNNVPIVTFDEFDKGGMSSLQWPDPLTNQQADIFLHLLKRIKQAHFCRLLDKKRQYNSSLNLYPYEKATMYEEPLLSSEELFDREHDICFIANHSPNRESIARAICSHGRLKCHVSIGAPKIPFDEFLWLHKRAKLFISSGAGGYGNERPQLLFSVAGMLQEKNDQLLLHPHTQLLNCLKISSKPTKLELETIYEIVNDKESLYDIYKNNYDFMKKYYSASYIASDVLDKILKHCS